MGGQHPEARGSDPSLEGQPDWDQPPAIKKGLSMALVALWFSKEKENEYEYFKALVAVELVAFLKSMGALTTEEKDLAVAADKRKAVPTDPKETFELTVETPDESEMIIQPDPEISDPDKGFGRPGSLKFHKNCIHEMETVESIEAYVISVTGEPVEKKYKSVGAAKNGAIRLIKGFLK